MEELQTSVFDNYVDNAYYCLKNEIFDREAADRVVESYEKWIDSEMTKIQLNKLAISLDNPITDEQIEMLSPDLKYRLRLILSVRAYRAFANEFFPQ